MTFISVPRGEMSYFQGNPSTAPHLLGPLYDFPNMKGQEMEEKTKSSQNWKTEPLIFSLTWLPWRKAAAVLLC